MHKQYEMFVLIYLKFYDYIKNMFWCYLVTVKVKEHVNIQYRKL